MAGQPAGIVGLLEGLVNEWLLRGLVLLSLVAHLVLILLAGIRRHKASGGRRALLWLAYQLATWSAPSALSKLFLDNTSRDERLHAFWMPILLMHLARPDNMSAYTLEDNVLVGRQLVDVPLQILGSIYALYKHIIVIGNAAGTLLPASCIMFSLGIAKYVENVSALWQGNLGSIRRSIKKLPETRHHPESWKGLDNEGALLVAHQVLYISKGAFADYSYGKKRSKQPWEEISKVVEMELSLMYDIMYTKAAVVHTWPGYIIRLASPLFIIAALLLFFFHNTDDQKIADVVITYILLIGTLFLEVGWLIKAVVSTWTYAFLKEDYLLHGSLLERRWHGFRRFAVALGVPRDPSRYRRWSGIVGQYNILEETTHDTTSRFSEILKFIGMEYQYSRGLEILPPVRDLLFERIWRMLDSGALEKKPVEKKKEEEEKKRPKMDPGAAQIMRRELDEALKFDREFQETVLTWHIATHIFLLCGLQKAGMYNFEFVEAIEDLSNYMMFLVVVRPSMVPGNQRGSLHDLTRDALNKIWKASGTSSCTKREWNLATILLNMMPESLLKENKMWEIGSIKWEDSVILPEGTLYAVLMLARLSYMTSWKEILDDFFKKSKSKQSKKQLEDLLYLSDSSYSRKYELNVQRMLELILDSWVRLLIYASTRCSRDSHAKQLSRGGELTTIVWMLAEHAGIYRNLV